MEEVIEGDKSQRPDEKWILEKELARRGEPLVETEKQLDKIETSLSKTTTGYESNAPAQATDPKEPKKCVSGEKIQVYGYMKKKVLSHLEENGCSPRSVDEVITASKFNKQSILEYMNQRIEMAETNVHEECGSLSFNNIEAWLKQFKKWNLPELCAYEPALVINAIANNEDLPEAEELEGVDLRSLYKFIGNALFGLPQAKLNEKSAEFLANEFEILVGEANTNVGDCATMLLKNRLQNYKELPCCREKEKCSIDPLCLEDEQKFTQ
ncbi:uncharacterized protein LOC128861744 [Anastrepha ludens]|uniref:uncharacterized protein LOC128861744 n=1 Tax=Anastrepha ludens TaxID=28586 RepID=UPI0023AF0E3E|nr:uncharacterized protein LOC128861744 [Anastrepha ludens]